MGEIGDGGWDLRLSTAFKFVEIIFHPLFLTRAWPVAFFRSVIPIRIRAPFQIPFEVINVEI